MSKSYMEEYQRWLDSPALSEEEWKELNSIAGDEKEIENRFYAPLELLLGKEEIVHAIHFCTPGRPCGAGNRKGKFPRIQPTERLHRRSLSTACRP